MHEGAQRFDRRTRRDGEERSFVAADFFGGELAALVEGQPAVAEWTASTPLRSLVVEVDGVRYGFGDGVRYGFGDGSGPDLPVVELSAAELNDLLNDHSTPVAMMANGTLRTHGRGALEAFLDQWLLWRAALDDRSDLSPNDLDLPEDLTRSFALDDDPAEITDFLDRAGYLHLRGVFTEAEMAAISADMDAVHHRYAPGDGNSWWATLADGTEALVRMQRFERVSAAGAALLADPRFLRIGELTGAGHVPTFDQDSKLEALYKPIGVVRGISDVPWHRDCSLGRHSYFCPSLTIGISVSPGGPTSGQLRVGAGSHRVHAWPSLIDPETMGVPNVALATETGDVTVHQSCTLHMAEPPTTTERRVLYTDHRLPLLGSPDAVAQNQARLRATREAAPANTSQVASSASK